MLRNFRVGLLCAALLLNSLSVFAQGQATAPANSEAEIQAKIRKEGMENSQVMKTLHYLTDVYGPRLTGSPNHKAAGEWAIKQMASWGFSNGHLEPWDFGHVGWLNERATGHILSPYKEPLVLETLAWTPSTNGTVRGQVYQMIPPATPTEDELKAFLEGEKDKVKGKIVLVGKQVIIPVDFSAQNKRMDDTAAKNSFSGNGPAGGPGGGPGGNRRGQGQPQQQPGQPRKLSARDVNQKAGEFLATAGALLMMTDTAAEGRMEQRRVRAFNNRNFDPTKFPPAVVVSNEDFGRMQRVLADGTPIEAEFNIVNQIYPEGKTSYNTISEIAGTDKKDEVIMLGGHLDSWHSATGATDNAIGCAMMMEAARILKAIGVKPRRTIRVALWGGEEQGLLGSQAYVKEHFGTAENPKPEYDKFGGYFNIDSGTGRPRGLSVFGPPEAADVLKAALAPFEDLGFYGVRAAASRAPGGTDSTSFNAAGLPGIGAQQDPIEYFNITWHTNMDTYERIIEDDVKKAAVVFAAAVYHLAMRDQMLPRFSKEQMPAPAARP
ncbi:MAG TPA: M20/M25/M40 family metallo-hydrolase [Blastocatellia bacterium]|nr:M20/M25/M40 family metallo-hydrolase [Blastocatellia bacterium]HMV87528.1 M20/M25/M40 family metallo-hydrolase [Blastocatellia bacterium]HMX27650.1 M20/M25/M40 family metallo-hydrolase [Blastocatellia bacterium]HMY75000.1 M20/M25/M40 family metallo-hydrolase [Blastocatellia bacterium]HMZ21432.1 M20/M25/M40 family metallo-hydrolase [Blastocatellia bacterium]